MSQVLPVIKESIRFKIRVAAIALAEAEGWELAETAFDWMDWSDERIAQQIGRVNPRSIDFVRRANAVVEAIADL